MGTDPSTIRKDIEQTRERMGDTVDALAYKSDVGARAKDAVHDRVDSVKERLGVAGERLSDATPDAGDVRAQARQAKGLAQDNPLGLAVGAVAVGFIAGMIIPNTRAENQRLAPVAGQLREQVQDAAQTAVEQGKAAAEDIGEVAKGAVADVADAAKDAGQEHAQQVKQEVAG